MGEVSPARQYGRALGTLQQAARSFLEDVHLGMTEAMTQAVTPPVLTEEERTTRYLRRVAAQERAIAQTALHAHVRQVRRDLGLRP